MPLMSDHDGSSAQEGPSRAWLTFTPALAGQPSSAAPQRMLHGTVQHQAEGVEQRRLLAAHENLLPDLDGPTSAVRTSKLSALCDVLNSYWLHTGFDCAGMPPLDHKTAATLMS